MSELSLLETVANHEKSLSESLSSAESEARALLDAAHDDAASALSKGTADLETEVGGLRREGSEARAAEEARIEKASDKRVADIRSGAQSKLDAVREEILRRILP